jgi:hypothetical protein
MAEYKEHRRKHKRYPIRWKTAVVFPPATQRPILHTETLDLSAGGGAIATEYGDLNGTTVTILLAQPPKQPGEQPKMLKLQAKIVSSSPGKKGYRHGMAFINVPPEGVVGLEEVLQAAAKGAHGEDPAAAALAAAAAATIPPAAAAPAPAAPPAAAPAAAAPAAAAPAAAAPAAAAAGGGRLAALKAAAAQKAAEEAARAKADSKEDKEDKVSEALKRAYFYFKELIEQLDQLKPAMPAKNYSIHGVPEFTDLAWDVGNLDLRSREVTPIRKLWVRIWIDYRLSKGKPILKIERTPPASEKVKQMLKDYGLQFSSRDDKTESGAIIKTTFGINFEVLCHLEMEANYDTFKVMLKMRNVERFGPMEYTLSPDAITQESLEELTGYLLCETNKVGPLLLQNPNP